MRLSLTTKRERIRHCILAKTIFYIKQFKELRTYISMAEASGYTCKQEITKINNDLDLIKYKVMNTLTDNIPDIENCTMMTYVRNGTLTVEIVDGRTVIYMRQEEERNKENEEPKGMAKLYTIMNG